MRVCKRCGKNILKDNMIKLALKYKPFWDINNGTTLCKSCHQKTYCRVEQN